LHQGQQLAAQLIERLGAVPGIHVYHAGPVDSRVPSVAFRSDQWPLDELQSRLQKHDITASVGFQCAPWAHEALGTHDTGVVRVSFGHEPPTDAIDRLLESLG